THALERRRRAREGKGTDVDASLPDGRAVRGGDLVKQTPALQADDARSHDEVGRHGVAGEAGPVDDQDAVAPAGEEHGRGRSATASPHHDDVVHGAPPWSTLK